MSLPLEPILPGLLLSKALRLASGSEISASPPSLCCFPGPLNPCLTGSGKGIRQKILLLPACFLIFYPKSNSQRIWLDFCKR
jgi:hypothetical protein